MALAGSKAFTPRPDAVDGMSCMRPWAPAELTALVLKPDSCLATAANREAGTPVRAEADSNNGTREAGTFRLAGSAEGEVLPVPSVGRMRRMADGSPTAWM